MFTTSKDLLYIVLAFCILWLTLFFSLMLYYFIVILKRGKEISDLLKEKMETVIEAIETLKKKIEVPMAFFAVLTEGVKQILEYLKSKKGQTGKKKK